ncbi:hypothetical protein BH09PLA1_BH09PLA1_34000 [soil metagenome]
MAVDGRGDRIGAVVLAAGASQRMGRNKSLLPIDGQPMLARAIGVLRSSAARIVVVTGFEPESAKAAAGDHAAHVKFAFNANYEAGGMLSSIQVGVALMRSGVDAFFLAPLDLPWVRESTLQQLTDGWRSSRADVVRPTFCGKHGHPILLDVRCIDPILALGDGATLNDFVRTKSTNAVDVAVPDAATIHDIDTPADYEAAMKRRASSAE